MEENKPFFSKSIKEALEKIKDMKPYEIIIIDERRLSKK